MNKFLRTLSLRPPWPPWPPWLKGGFKDAKGLGNVANLGHLTKYIIINNIYLKVAKVAKYLWCSQNFRNFKMAKFLRIWQPCQRFGHLELNKQEVKKWSNYLFSFSYFY